jgi:hypothetical protein
MKTYHGSATNHAVEVRTPDSVSLLAHHRTPEGVPEGLVWGYHGSGPFHLAWAVLRDAMGAEPPRRLALAFKHDWIDKLDADSSWSIDVESIREWLAQQAVTPCLWR